MKEDDIGVKNKGLYLKGWDDRDKKKGLENKGLNL
jgi:hypothetical protein